MNPIFIVLTRDLVYRCRWNFLICASIANLLPLSVFWVFRAQGLATGDPGMQVLFYRFLTMNGLFCAASLIDNNPFPSRLFVAPISSRRLFVYLLVPQIVIAGGLTWFSIVFQSACMAQAFPPWSIVLFACCCVAVCWSTYWMMYQSPWRPVVQTITVGGLLSWYFARTWDFLPGIPTHDFANIERQLLIGISVVFSYFGSIGFARFRCGETIASSPDSVLLQQDSEHHVIRPNRFASPFAAQRWFEWRSKGQAFPLVVTAGITVSVLTWAIRSRNLDELFRGFLVCGSLLPGLGGLMGLFALGNFGFTWTMGDQKGDFDLGHFLASRPLTNTAMAYANLCSLGKSVLISWALWAIPFLVLFRIKLNEGLLDAVNVAWWYLPSTLLLWWAPTAVSACVAMRGDLRLFAVLLITIVLTFACAMILSNVFLTHEERFILFQFALTAGGIATIIGSFWLFNVAYRRRLISRVTAINCGSLWILLAAVVAFECWRNVSRTSSMSLIAVCTATVALAITPFAAAPLAIAKNRSR